jgi:hypothetical protein
MKTRFRVNPLFATSTLLFAVLMTLPAWADDSKTNTTTTSASTEPFFLRVKTQMPGNTFMDELKTLQEQARNTSLQASASAPENQTTVGAPAAATATQAIRSVSVGGKPNLPACSTGLLAPHSQFGSDGLGDGGAMYGGQLILPATKLAPLNLEIAE